MDIFTSFLIAAAGIAVWRIAYQLRLMTRPEKKDWDTQLIERLRRSGMSLFTPIEVDFFLAMPASATAETIAAVLRLEGYSVDVSAVSDSNDYPYSVHARHVMHLNIETLRPRTRRLAELVVAAGGRYDGWAPGPNIS